MHEIATRLRDVGERIRSAAVAAARDPAQVQLVAVSKTFPADAVLAALSAGQRAFGENYVQEALAKMQAVETALAHGGGGSAARPEWHFIGPIQSNKTRAIARHFDWVHTVDRLKVAQRLSEARSGSLPLQVCLQVNVGGEASKSGVAPAEVEPLAHAVAQLPGLRLRGLMTIPRPSADMVEQRM
ncbi:MAG: YggS family pyridoxal phosphate-dependent enzyme, partial [Burkholderiales bacterium]|nr:YggS family pyridoxal phosphate-dependent enzyme [Burkholderiales bacterium]